MHRHFIEQLNDQISSALNRRIEINAFEATRGGCINQAAILHTDAEAYFIKYNKTELLSMFECEAEGLEVISATHTLRVPRPVCTGIAGPHAFLVMEALSLGADHPSMEYLAEHLAAMHRVTADAFGWHSDNYIGSTPQMNQRKDSWIDFWREQRLGYQLGLIEDKGGYPGLLNSGYKLMENLDLFFEGYQPLASLLHGDLWSGNYDFMTDDEPVIYDPAVYYGDRETDIAMTELFGGFSANFYTTYRDHYPLDVGYERRKTLYNLYHILNHVNLFGGTYSAQAQGMIDHLLSEIRG